MVRADLAAALFRNRGTRSRPNKFRPNDLVWLLYVESAGDGSSTRRCIRRSDLTGNTMSEENTFIYGAICCVVDGEDVLSTSVRPVFDGSVVNSENMFFSNEYLFLYLNDPAVNECLVQMIENSHKKVNLDAPVHQLSVQRKRVDLYLEQIFRGHSLPTLDFLTRDDISAWKMLATLQMKPEPDVTIEIDDDSEDDWVIGLNHRGHRSSHLIEDNQEVIHWFRQPEATLYLMSIMDGSTRSDRHDEAMSGRRLAPGTMECYFRSNPDFLRDAEEVDGLLFDLIRDNVFKPFMAAGSFVQSNLHPDVIDMIRYIYDVLLPEGLIKYLMIKFGWQRERAEANFQVPVLLQSQVEEAKKEDEDRMRSPIRRSHRVSMKSSPMKPKPQETSFELEPLELPDLSDVETDSKPYSNILAGTELAPSMFEIIPKVQSIRAKSKKAKLNKKRPFPAKKTQPSKLKSGLLKVYPSKPEIVQKPEVVSTKQTKGFPVPSKRKQTKQAEKKNFSRSQKNFGLKSGHQANVTIEVIGQDQHPVKLESSRQTRRSSRSDQSSQIKRRLPFAKKENPMLIKKEVKVSTHDPDAEKARKRKKMVKEEVNGGLSAPMDLETLDLIQKKTCEHVVPLKHEQVLDPLEDNRISMEIIQTNQLPAAEILPEMADSLNLLSDPSDNEPLSEKRKKRKCVKRKISSRMSNGKVIVKVPRSRGREPPRVVDFNDFDIEESEPLRKYCSKLSGNLDLGAMQPSPDQRPRSITAESSAAARGRRLRSWSTGNRTRTNNTNAGLSPLSHPTLVVDTPRLNLSSLVCIEETADSLVVVDTSASVVVEHTFVQFDTSAHTAASGLLASDVTMTSNFKDDEMEMTDEAFIKSDNCNMSGETNDNVNILIESGTSANFNMVDDDKDGENTNLAFSASSTINTTDSSLMETIDTAIINNITTESDCSSSSIGPEEDVTMEADKICSTNDDPLDENDRISKLMAKEIINAVMLKQKSKIFKKTVVPPVT